MCWENHCRQKKPGLSPPLPIRDWRKWVHEFVISGVRAVDEALIDRSKNATKLLAVCRDTWVNIPRVPTLCIRVNPKPIIRPPSPTKGPGELALAALAGN